MKVVYLFTTFPVLSETFLQRELREMKKLNPDLSVHSIWGGEESWEEIAISRFSLWQLFTLFYWLPYWLCKKPETLKETLDLLFQASTPSLKNIGETLLGLGFALTQAKAIAGQKTELIHGVWASMPATAAWLIHRLTGTPFSMGAHAYDVFQQGGDWLLSAKLKTARFIHTSTEATRKHLILCGADPHKVKLIRRGLPLKDDDKNTEVSATQLDCLHILSIGRLVEKKGYLHQLDLYAELKKASIPFQARIIGAGPFEKSILQKRKALNLETEVTLLGKRNFAEVAEQYRWADAFFFTGIIAQDGDRDGLPNVIPEAMQAGVIVLTTPVSGAPEAIIHEETGFVIPIDQPQHWLAHCQQIMQGGNEIAALQETAQQWVHNHFDASKNTVRLWQTMQETKKN